MEMHINPNEEIIGYIHSDCIRPGPLQNGLCSNFNQE